MAVIHLGTATTLAKIGQATISNGDVAYIWLNSYPRKMIYDSSSTEAENTTDHPYYIRPDDYAVGVWVEDVGADQPAVWSADQIITGTLTSINWGASAGSEYDLDNAKFRLGGSTSNDVISMDADDATYRLAIGHATYGSAPFRVTKEGVLTATGATITGEITATTGVIGGWTVLSTELHNTNLWLDATDKQIAINSQTFGNDGIQLDYNAGNPRAYVGDGSDAYLNFDGTKITWKAANSELDASGNLIATSATLSGAITATSGAIGGWDVISGYLYSLVSGTPSSSPSDGIVLKSGADAAAIIYENAEKRIEIGSLSSGVYGMKVYADNGSDVIFEASDTQIILAGFTPDTSEGFYAGTGATRVQMKAGEGIWTGATAFGSAPFRVSNAGALVATSATITGAITATSGSITGDMVVSGAVYSTGKTTYADTDAGFWLGNDSGTYKFNIGDASSFIKWSGAALSIQMAAGETFDLYGGMNVYAGGDITFTSSDSNPGLLKFGTYFNIGAAADKALGLCIWPTTADDRYFWVGYDPINTTIKEFDYVAIFASEDGALMRAGTNLSTNYAELLVNRGVSGLHEASMYSRDAANQAWVTLNSDGDFYPQLGTCSLGKSGTPWTNFFLTGYQEVTDDFWLGLGAEKGRFIFRDETVDEISVSAAGFGGAELSADPANPAEGAWIMWMSDGTGAGDDGDIMMKITAGGSTKTATLVDFSGI